MQDEILNTKINLDIYTIVLSLILLLAAILVIKILTYLLDKFSEKWPKYRIHFKLFLPLIRLLIYTFVIYVIIGSIINITSTQLIAFSGLLGAALGIGLKDLFADVVGGLVLIFDKPYQVGDKIRVNDNYGEVVDIGIILTKLKTPDDNILSIPNYTIFTQAIANASDGKLEMLVEMDLYIDSTSDINKAIKIFKDAIISSKYIFASKERPYQVLLEDNPFYRKLIGKAYVRDHRKEFKFKSDVTERTWQEFLRQGIKTPTHRFDQYSHN